MITTDQFLKTKCHNCITQEARISQSSCKYNIMKTHLDVPGTRKCDTECRWYEKPTKADIKDARKYPSIRKGEYTAKTDSVSQHERMKKIARKKRKLGMTQKKRIIKELSEAGVKQKTIALRYNISPARVSQLKRGAM